MATLASKAVFDKIAFVNIAVRCRVVTGAVHHSILELTDVFIAIGEC